ncbi:MAG: PKD domain-containing protein, partial [Thermoplasmata archaeon]|nr:PKD domain-containing protein [Thermoplasmata archaeon]
NGSSSWDIDGQIVSWFWNMGDGATYTDPVITHKYMAEGIYLISLTATDNDGLTNTDHLRVTVVSENYQPNAVIRSSGVGYRGIPMIFDGSFSSDPDGMIANYTWDFGDGQMGYGAIVFHTYPDVYGVYKVTLTVTDDNYIVPMSDQATYKISIVNQPGVPVAKIVSPSIAIVGQAAQLSGLMSYPTDEGNSIASYYWDYGDTGTGTGATPSHTWAATGTYSITLTVQDNNGNSSFPVTQSIQVVPAGARNIALSLDRHSLLPGETTTLTIRVVDGQGSLVSTYSGTVDLSCNETVGVTLPANATITNGVGLVSVSFANAGAYRIDATLDTMTSSEFASANQRTVEFRIYDIFEYPLYDYWKRRMIYYSLMDEPYRNTTPVVEIYRPGTQVTEAELTTTYRLNVEARNVNEIRITNPTFVPRMNPTAGTTGNAHYDVSYQYQSDAQLWALYQQGKISLGQYNAKDGWEYYITGNLTMDRTSAAHLIDLPVSEADVPAWWAINNYTIGYDNWEWIWWTNESGYTLNSGRVDIRASDDGYPINQGYWNSEFWLNEWADGSVSFQFWRIGYGEDILLMRQLYWGGESYGNVYPNGTAYGLIPYECWYEDFNMSLDIEETHANVSLDCGVVYGFRAWKSDTAPAGTAAWRWENIKSDYMAAISVTKSEIDPYSSRDLQYVSWDPGSSAYGLPMDYDYTPNVWSMVLGETLIIERPTCLAIGYLPSPMLGNYSSKAFGPEYGGYWDGLRLLEKFGNASLHPVGCPAGTAIVDAGTGDLKINGPFYPIVQTVAGLPWLVSEPSPRIEIWV